MQQLESQPASAESLRLKPNETLVQTAKNWAQSHDITPPKAPKGSRLLGRTVVAAGVAVGLAGGLIHGEAAPNVAHTIQPAVSAEAFSSSSYGDSLDANNLTITLQPELSVAPSKPSEQLVSEFEKILGGDNAEQAAQIYHDVFEDKTYENMTTDQLLQQVDPALASFSQARSQVEFQALPANIDQLKTDAFSDVPSIPLETYQAAVTEQLAALHIDAHMDWQVATSADDANARGVPLTDLARPLTAEEWADPSVRASLVRFMLDVAAMPKADIEAANVPTIFFGLTPGISTGLMTHQPLGSAARYMIINPSGYDLGGTFPHEVLHELQDVDFPEGIDSTWQKINPPGFKYDDSLGDGQTANPMFTNLRAARESPSKATDLLKKTVVDVDPYGNINASEDGAMLIGENLFQPKNTEHIFEVDNNEILGKKLVVFIANEEGRNKVVASYYEQQLEISHLAAALVNALYKVQFRSSGPVNDATVASIEAAIAAIDTAKLPNG